MKIFKSIKWRLQIWYGLILVAVLVALGVTAYQLERNLLLSRIDGELQRRFAAINEALHGHGPGRGRPPFDRPPPGQMPGNLPPPEDSQPREFHLPPPTATLFDSNEPHLFWFIIIGPDGNQIAHSTNTLDAVGAKETHLASEINRLDLQNAPPNLFPGRRPAPETFTQSDLRAIIHFVPSGETIWIGCDIAPELDQLKTTALILTGIGTVILLFGLAGGWWISSSAIRPVENISTTAVKIAAGDLSHRINTAETESELGQLAVVLNSTFARLEAAFDQQKQFASDAAHELRTPISVILTQTQMALKRERDAKDYKETIEACQRAGQRMRRLITALLELARLDVGQEQMKHLRFDFSKTVGECVELVRPLADERGVNISTELAPVEIEGDSERLSLVITNLLTNAVQYNHDGGQVKIGAKLQDHMAVLTVSDTGQGIPAEDLPRVFERFYRADKSRSSGNAGLGLAISKALVTAHGGSIDVVSEENVGTTFTVRLPATA